MVIGTIMGHGSMPAGVSSQSNRELALLDTDKLLSLSLGTIKPNNIRFEVMRSVLQTTLNRNFSRTRNIFIDDRPPMNERRGANFF